MRVSGAIKDVGKITWSEKSVRYVYEMDSTYIGLVNIIYDTSASFEPLVNVKNFPTAGNPAKWRWIDSFLMSYVIDTIQGEFKTNLPTAYELGVGYIWLPWYSTYLHIQKYHYYPNYQFTIINRFKAWRSVHFNINMGVGTYTHYTLGAQMMISSKSIDYFIGSEQIGNGFLKFTQLGFDFHMGFAWKL